LSSLLGSGDSNTSNIGGLKLALSSLGALNRDHLLMRQVQQNADIQDPDQATQYTPHRANLLNEQADKDQGIGSLLGSLTGGGNTDDNNSQQSTWIGDIIHSIRTQIFLINR
jgi:hypothetical protein